VRAALKVDLAAALVPNQGAARVAMAVPVAVVIPGRR